MLRRRLIFFSEMAEFFLPVPAQEFERLVRQSLRAYFDFKGDEVIIPFHKLGLLESAWQEIKKTALPGSILPLPFSLAPSGAPRHFLRPGKVYLSPSEGKQAQKYLQELSFVVTLTPWRGLLEMVFPSNKDAELLFHFRDFFWTGPYPPCPFCRRRWHPPQRCPGLKQREPMREVSRLLRERPHSLAQRLNKLVEKGKWRPEEESLLLGPYVYLRPGFLRILFGTKARLWESMALKPDQEKGGHLFLGLEALLGGDLAQAKKHFVAAQQKQDPRPNLGLTFVALVERDFPEALYQAENARSEAQTPLFRAYSFFLRGWSFEVQGKSLEAEELYRQAYKEDRSFWPALLHLASMEIKFAPERVLPALQQLLHYPLALPSFFLDERLLPLAQEAEKLLLETYEKKQAQALSRLTQAEDALRPLLKALPEEEVKSFSETLAEIRQQIYDGGLLDLLEAEKRAFDLSLELQGIEFRHRKKLLQKLEKIQDQLNDKKELWKRFPYKDTQRQFGEKLALLEEEIQKIQRLSRDRGKNLRLMAERFKKVEKLWAELEEQEGQLRREWLFRQQVLSFVKVFFLLEFILFGVFFLFFKVLGPVQPSLLKMANISSFLFFSLLFFLFALWRSLLQKRRLTPLPREKR